MSNDSCTRISPKRRKRKRVDSSDSQITEEERNEKISSENIKAESSDTSDFEEVTIEGTTSSFTEEVSESSSITCNVPAEDLSIESMNNPAVYMYMCKHCNIYFSQLHLLRHHTESMHPHINAIKSNLEPPFDCKVCNFVTLDRATLTRHITLKHHLSKLLNVKKPSITIQLHPVKSSQSPEHSPPPSPSKPAQNPEKVEDEHVEDSMKEEVTSDEVKLETSKTALQEEPKLTQECGDHDYIHIYGLQKSPVPEDYDGEDQSLEQSPSFNQPLITTESEMMVRPSSPVDEILDEDLAQEEIVSTSDIPEESQIEQQLILEVVDMIPQQELEFEIEHQPLVFDQTVAIENSTLVSESNDTLHATELDEDSSLSETVITDSAEEKRDREANQIPPSTRVRNNYICEYCHTVVEGRGAMRFHIRREHNAEWLARKRQELKFKPIYDSEDLTHPCHLCEFKARRRVTLNAHIRRKHPTEKRRRGKPPIKPPVGEEFKCGGCDFTTKHIFKLELHIERKHTLEPTYECEMCGKKYKTKIDLAAHIKFLHMNSASVCDICGKLCRNTNALHVHRKNEHYTPKFKCPHCARRMVTQENLNQHIERQHLNRVKPLCHYCGKSFDQINKLKEHVRSHTGERPFKCKVCGRSFGRAGVYRQHMLTHSGVKPYVCDICGKAFTQKPGLIGHRKSHPGAKDPLPVVFINEIIKKVTQEGPSTSDGPAKEVTLGANNTESSGSDGPSLPNEPSILQDEPVIHIPENPEDGEFNVLSYASDQHDDPLESLQLSEIIEECPEEIINDISL
ncbi:hypothetical protein QAD02_010898 [Eretmocerus hayati]|uniref:Uncharacterized protein n=1 Tax=Eretmocerus hayati TaxID=131215 RepID=A0ACC2NVF0_9HYME|nr:hypothetical protein QAD02_010898 [Eretmocerus hayati]